MLDIPAVQLSKITSRSFPNVSVVTLALEHHHMVCFFFFCFFLSYPQLLWVTSGSAVHAGDGSDAVLLICPPCSSTQCLYSRAACTK